MINGKVERSDAIGWFFIRKSRPISVPLLFSSSQNAILCQLTQLSTFCPLPISPPPYSLHLALVPQPRSRPNYHNVPTYYFTFPIYPPNYFFYSLIVCYNLHLKWFFSFFFFFSLTSKIQSVLSLIFLKHV